MGYWGLAYAAGPDYNLAWTEFAPADRAVALQLTYHNAREAVRRAANGAPVEAALAEALTARYQAPAVTDNDLFDQWNDDYAAAMRQVYARFPDDPDVCTLTAEALMCRTPWQLWDLVNECPAPGADTAEAITIMEQAMSTGADQHPGLLHMYIHAMEMSPYPEKALPASDTLLPLVPDSGHLVHMPSHIYILCGEYEKALQANVAAVEADRRWTDFDDTLGIYTIYRCHNYHFIIYAALFLGQFEAALAAADEMIGLIPPEGLHHEQAKLVAYLEGYIATKPHVYIRFGKWDEIIAEPLPSDPEVYCVGTATWLYAKGVAYAATGDIANAEETRRDFHRAWQAVPEDRMLFNNKCRDTLQIAAAMLDGELEYRKGNYDEAYAYLRRSVQLYDELNYTEPWAWMQPTRHALGALLLEQGHVAEALSVYRADLGLDKSLVRPSRHLDNLWSLHGYVECLEMQGQVAEAAPFRAKLAGATALADVPVSSSCFCRQNDDCCD
ncbi:MAG: tetratricopeptide repeat protein, partial [Anaerolineales bacterium]|nr:tetratricopeptide repeat protein [Anaerolineales bacterium]